MCDKSNVGVSELFTVILWRSRAEPGSGSVERIAPVTVSERVAANTPAERYG